MRIDGEIQLSPEDWGRLEKLAVRLTPHADDEILRSLKVGHRVLLTCQPLHFDPVGHKGLEQSRITNS
jgi:hypothetical protein